MVEFSYSSSDPLWLDGKISDRWLTGIPVSHLWSDTWPPFLRKFTIIFLFGEVAVIHSAACPSHLNHQLLSAWKLIMLQFLWISYFLLLLDIILWSHQRWQLLSFFLIKIIIIIEVKIFSLAIYEYKLIYPIEILTGYFALSASLAFF